MSNKSLITDALLAGGGGVCLAPSWGPRPFFIPGGGTEEAGPARPFCARGGSRRHRRTMVFVDHQGRERSSDGGGRRAQLYRVQWPEGSAQRGDRDGGRSVSRRGGDGEAWGL